MDREKESDAIRQEEFAQGSREALEKIRREDLRNQALVE